jgi:hypothetical protein
MGARFSSARQPSRRHHQRLEGPGQCSATGPASQQFNPALVLINSLTPGRRASREREQPQCRVGWIRGVDGRPAAQSQHFRSIFAARRTHRAGSSSPCTSETGWRSRAKTREQYEYLGGDGDGGPSGMQQSGVGLSQLTTRSTPYEYRQRQGACQSRPG